VSNPSTTSEPSAEAPPEIDRSANPSVSASPSRTRGGPDAQALAAVDQARAAAVEEAGQSVGEYLGAHSDGDRVVSHDFAADLPGYVGWFWSVTIARASRARLCTVDEVVLLPGDTALRPPAWVPWSQRLLPGDLGLGDLLLTEEDDPRLVPGYADDGEDEMRALADDFALGRIRVLSREGRLDAAERWVEGDQGPTAPMAKQALAHCGTCGFMLGLAGSLRAAFGVCANEYSPADAKVVSVEFGCGAHSESIDPAGSRSAPSGEVYDDDEIMMEADVIEPVESEPALSESAEPVSDPTFVVMLADQLEPGQAESGTDQAGPEPDSMVMVAEPDPERG
jgi:hypothetical protein